MRLFKLQPSHNNSKSHLDFFIPSRGFFLPLQVFNLNNLKIIAISKGRSKIRCWCLFGCYSFFHTNNGQLEKANQYVSCFIKHKLLLWVQLRPLVGDKTVA